MEFAVFTASIQMHMTAMNTPKKGIYISKY